MSCNMMWLLAQVFPVCTWLLLHSLVWVSQLEEKRLDQVRIVHFMLLLYEWMESLRLSDDIYDILRYSLHVFNLPLGLMPTKLKSQQHSHMVWTMDSRSVLSHAYTRRATRSRLYDGLQTFCLKRVCLPYLPRPVAEWLRRKGVSLVSDSLNSHAFVAVLP